MISNVEFDMNAQKKVEEPTKPTSKPKPTPARIVQVEAQLNLEGGENEFIDDYQLPASNIRGIFYIRKFLMDPSLKITLSYQNNADEPMPYFLIEVTYTSEEGAKSRGIIKLKKLPIKLNYMVYFIRRHLRVHFNDEHT